MGCDARGKVVLENVTVDVFADIMDVAPILHQCLIDDNPGRVRITQFGFPGHSEADIIVWITRDQEFKYGFLARLVKALWESKQSSYTDQNGNIAYWQESND